MYMQSEKANTQNGRNNDMVDWSEHHGLINTTWINVALCNWGCETYTSHQDGSSWRQTWIWSWTRTTSPCKIYINRNKCFDNIILFFFFWFFSLIYLKLWLDLLPWGVFVLLKFYWVPDIVQLVLGRFSHFNIAIAYSNSKFCGTWTSSFCELTWNFSKTSTLYARFAEILTVFTKTCNVKVWKSTEHKLHKIWHSTQFQQSEHILDFILHFYKVAETEVCWRIGKWKNRWHTKW